jgi:hypothetical protein
MPRKQPYQNRIELLQGTLDLLILQTLRWGPQHGYGISQAIRNQSGEVFRMEGVRKPAARKGISLDCAGQEAAGFRTVTLEAGDGSNGRHFESFGR